MNNFKKMEKDISRNHLSVFEQIKKNDEHGIEFWSARYMAKVLEYSEYRHFLPVIEKAKESCKNSGQNVSNHFEDILEMIEIGKCPKTCLLLKISKQWRPNNANNYLNLKIIIQNKTLVIVDARIRVEK